jgi:hypothetical protein
MTIIAALLDAFSLLLVWWVVRRTRWQPRTHGREAAAFGSFALAFAGLALAAPAGVSAWERLAAAATIVIALFAATALPSDTGRGPEDGRATGGGGSRPGTPQLSGPTGYWEPEWWPDFEREFASYVAQRPPFG